MPKLTDFAKPTMSFKKGTFGFKKRRKVAEAVGKKDPGLSMSSKFKIATSAIK